ncbi:cytochrome P450 [Streptomyces sp. NPDC093544]|uniref:cytochrome P450 n=1 Tax=Streptomyces sp. NPDC093544 TaxID=3155200 RepID=UPI0034141BB1
MEADIAPEVSVSDEVDGLLAELFLTPEGLRDPYPRYERIQELTPVHHTALGHWMVTGYDDVNTLLREQHALKDPYRVFAPWVGKDEWESHAALRRLPNIMLWANPPDHTRLRKLAGFAFTNRAVQAMRPQIAQMVDNLADKLDAAGGFDYMKDFAFPLPAMATGRMLGLPDEDLPSLQGPMRAFQDIYELGLTPEALAACDEGAQFTDDYFAGLVESRRRSPGEDLLSALIAAKDGQDKLSQGELIGMCNLLFGAGFETTTNLLGNGMLALLRHPDQMAKLRDDPTLVPGAVEEMLRYDSPTQLGNRVTDGPVRIGGVEIPDGSSVVALVGAAHRDPRRYPDPARFDVTRNDAPVLSFSSGIHYCLGASLARLEAQIAFSTLLTRFPRLRVADGADIEFRPRLTLRGVESLPISVD